MERLLECLERERVRRLYIFSDGPATDRDAANVQAVRHRIRRITFCETIIKEAEENLGLGPSILRGVTEVSRLEEAFVVAEDDLIFCPGTYAWMAAALRRYAEESRVMSVAGWTHPRVTPAGTAGPFFDRRAECWLWGTWSRAWVGMDVPASVKMRLCIQRGIPADLVGHDLPDMAQRELRDRIWAVRWLYHHLLNDGLCLRPPVCLVRHLGNDLFATHSGSESWDTELPESAPDSNGVSWPHPEPAPGCDLLWREATRPSPSWRRWAGRLLHSFLRRP